MYPFELEEQARSRQAEALRTAEHQRRLRLARAAPAATEGPAGRRPAGLAGTVRAVRAVRAALTTLGAALRRTPGSAGPRPAPARRHQPA
jgi:hypothetical protein